MICDNSDMTEQASDAFSFVILDKTCPLSRIYLEFIRWIMIYPVDSAIQALYNRPKRSLHGQFKLIHLSRVRLTGSKTIDSHAPRLHGVYKSIQFLHFVHSNLDMDLLFVYIKKRKTKEGKLYIYEYSL